jgi:hypothetical protein
LSNRIENLNSSAIFVISLSKYNVIVETNTNPQVYHVHHDVNSDTITVRNNKINYEVSQAILRSDQQDEPKEITHSNGLIPVTVKR